MLKQIKGASSEVMVVYVQALLMPNGEVISRGKTLGWNNHADGSDLAQVLFFESDEDNNRFYGNI